MEEEKIKEEKKDSSSWWKILLAIALLLFFSALVYGTLKYMGLELTPKQNFEDKLKIVSPSEQIEETEKVFDVTKKSHPDVSKLNLKVDLGPLDFNLGSVMDATKIFSSKAVYNYTDLEPEIKESYTDEANIIYGCASEQNTHIFNWSDMVAKYDLYLTDPKFPTVLDLEIGSADGEVVLQETTLEKVEFKVGSGELDFSLRAPNNTSLTMQYDVGSGTANLAGLAYANLTQFDGAIGNGDMVLDFSGDTDHEIIKDNIKSTMQVGSGVVTIILPQNYGYSIKHKIGNGRINIGDEEKLKGTDEFKSKNNKEAEFKIDFDITLGSGTVVFE
ncbi:cell wall-active antibiotics response protein [Patescibacteria group bacterium]|nr:cell wall-active antibiotics response protein [Patescibacteria group bacterium]MBU1673279.1 cell wall-active antibiotics response protein [Patescibacteria group bacterium]MBU1964087.1 cell wall-active antibiotics response protein [Patescibacteria group bacterium]